MNIGGGIDSRGASLSHAQYLKKSGCSPAFGTTDPGGWHVFTILWGDRGSMISVRDVRLNTPEI